MSKLAIGISFTPGTSFPLTRIQHAGFECIELVLFGSRSELDENGLRERFTPFIEEAAQLNLPIWSVHLPFGHEWDISTLDMEESKEIINHHIVLLQWIHQAGIKHAVLHPSYEPIEANERADRVIACHSALGELEKVAIELGIRISVENLPRTCLGNTSAEMKGLITGRPGLGICCDTNHTLFETPEQFIKAVGSRIVTTHLSDYDGVDEKHWLPGAGIIDWKRVMDAFQQVGYDGPFVLEVDEGIEPLEVMASWKKMIKHSSN